MEYVNTFCLVWVVYSLQNQLSGMKYELSFKWVLNTFKDVISCWKCFTFWAVLIVTRDVYLASVLSFAAYILDTIQNQTQTKL